MIMSRPFYRGISQATTPLLYPFESTTTPPTKIMPFGTKLLRTAVLVCFALMLTVLLHAGMLYSQGPCLVLTGTVQDSFGLDLLELENRAKVDMEIFVMSKCPDAEDAEATILNVMENVGHKVSLNFTYIASWYNTSQGEEIECKHGPTECLGNRQQLCFQKYHPTKILSFISCLNRTPSKIGNSLSYTLHCAEKAKVDDYTTVIQPCAESLEGQDLLEDSIQRCDLLDTHTSATIRISGKNVCVRDGGIWKDCKDVLSQGGGNVALGLQVLIEKEWKKMTSNRLFWQTSKAIMR